MVTGQRPPTSAQLRNQSYRLLINGSGTFHYQKLSRGARPKRVRWWKRVRSRKLPNLTTKQLTERLSKLVRPAPPGREPIGDGLFSRAIRPDGKEVSPDSRSGGYHGTTRVTIAQALKHGLPARGTDRRLLEHAEARNKNSAFRGTTRVVADPISGNGAAYWAGKGGWVYEIRNVPGWDVNAQLNGRVRTLAGYRGNLMNGEQEVAIPARVPPSHIKAWGKVEDAGGGRLIVRSWTQNPNYKPAP